MDDSTRNMETTPTVNTESAPESAPESTPDATQEITPDAVPETRTGRNRRTTIIVAVLVVALALVSVGGWMLYGAVTTRLEAAKQLDEATALLQAADEVVLDVDEVIRAEIDEEVGETAEGLREEVPGAIEDLQRAVGLIEEAIPGLSDSERERAVATRESAQARIDMLAEADEILAANAMAATALPLAERAWDKVLEAETVSEEAVKKYNELTRDSVTESSRLTSQAETMVAEARQLFSEAATSFPEVDLSLYVQYTDQKLALLAISKQGNQLWLDGKLVEANQNSERYNTEEKKVIEVAGKLPDSTAQPVAEAYERVAGGPTQRYFNARDRASAADEKLKRL